MERVEQLAGGPSPSGQGTYRATDGLREVARPSASLAAEHRDQSQQTGTCGCRHGSHQAADRGTQGTQTVLPPDSVFSPLVIFKG